MRRLRLFLIVVILIGGAITAQRVYPSQKGWMRAGYVQGFRLLNAITGNDFAPPDRFK